MLREFATILFCLRTKQAMPHIFCRTSTEPGTSLSGQFCTYRQCHECSFWCCNKTTKDDFFRCSILGFRLVNLMKISEVSDEFHQEERHMGFLAWYLLRQNHAFVLHCLIGALMQLLSLPSLPWHVTFSTVTDRPNTHPIPGPCRH